MSDQTWPFPQMPDTEGLDIASIFGDSKPESDTNPFDVPEPKPAAASPAPAPRQRAAEAEPAAAPQNVPHAVQQPAQAAPPAPAPAQPVQAAPENPIAAAFADKTAENTQKGLLEKPPVFQHKNVKEPIEDASMTFEELRIHKAEDFADLEEGKYVSWSVDYCGIHRDIKDPKGTTIISVKESIERSREFLDALKKSKGKVQECVVKPKVVMKNKGVAATYKGHFGSLDEARASDKVICLIPSDDGRIYELRKTEQGEFVAPKQKVAEFQTIRAGFSPALPLIPLSLMGQIISFFRSFMEENAEYEAMAQFYWDREAQEFFAFIPQQTVCRDEIEADLRDCPYEDEERYLCYADIHSHNSMKAFFSHKDDMDERGTGLYFVVGELDRFFPSIRARISCGGSFVPIDPGLVMEGLDHPFPTQWPQRVTKKGEKDGKKRIFPPASKWTEEIE